MLKGYKVRERLGTRAPAFTVINYIRGLIAQILDDNGIHFLHARKFCMRPTSEFSASEQSRCSSSVEHAVLV